ncbi:MAG: ATP-binding cassette domain-containing protein [Flavobacteriaceae bacterium]|nr:ATP-binding cassette domain-containing protein [Flavobacteriaceae bacterium]
MSLLEVKQVSKSFGTYKALDQVSLSVPKGSIFGLLGPNGAGKTTLIRIVNQITMPDSGTVYLDGEKLAPHHISDIGYLPEERGLYKSMKVGEQALYLAQLKGMSKSDAKKALKVWFERLDIGHWWDKKIQELSKGMAQKIQFVVTVLHRPKLLIFDEPFSGFDPINAQVIQQEILRLRDEGATVIFSTHRMESVEELCDHIALVHQSKKILDGNLNDIKRQHLSNRYAIGLACEQSEKVQKALEGQFDLSPTRFKSVYQGLQFSVQLSENESPNALLHELGKHGLVYHFVAEVPTANDLFVQSIQQNPTLNS